MSEATVTQKISHALSWSLLLRAITLISTLVLSVIIVRGLGSHDFGIFSLLRNIIIYAGIFCSFGLDAALLRFVPEQIAEGDWVGFTATVSKVLLFHLPLIMLTFVVFFLLRGLFANLYSNEVTAYLLISALIAGLLAYKNSLTQLFIALYRFRWLSIVTVASSALWIIFTFLLLRLGVQIRGVLAAQALSFFVLICMLVLGLRKQLRFPLKFTYSVGNHRLLAYSGTSLTNSVLNLIVQRQSEIFFVGYYLGTEAAGKYDLGYYLPQMSLEVISGIIWSLGIVGFSEAITRNPNKLGVGIRRYYKFLALLLLPIAIFGAGWADKIILLVYGEEMSVAGNLAQAFSIAHLLFFITVPVATALWALEKAWITIPFRIGSAVLDILLAIVLIPRFGLVGAVLAVSITMVISVPVVLYLGAKVIGELHIPYAYIIRCIFASTLMLALLPLRSFITNLLDFVGVLVLSSGFLVLGIRIFGLIGPEEKEIIEGSKLPYKELLIKIFMPKKVSWFEL